MDNDQDRSVDPWLQQARQEVDDLDPATQAGIVDPISIPPTVQPTAPPGYYPDPSTGQPRFFDGQQWAPLQVGPQPSGWQGPAPQHFSGPTAYNGGNHTTVVIQGATGGSRSPVLAFILALFFGPLGMLYATVPGAIVMFFVHLAALVLTAGLGLLLTVPAGAVWAAVAASRSGGGHVIATS